MLGDVVISVERPSNKQGRMAIDSKQELVKLLIHGIVHLIGYDHERSPRDARDHAPGREKNLSPAL